MLNVKVRINQSMCQQAENTLNLQHSNIMCGRSSEEIKNNRWFKIFFFFQKPERWTVVETSKRRINRSHQFKDWRRITRYIYISYPVHSETNIWQNWEEVINGHSRKSIFIFSHFLVSPIHSSLINLINKVIRVSTKLSDSPSRNQQRCINPLPPQPNQKKKEKKKQIKSNGRFPIWWSSNFDGSSLDWKKPSSFK